MRRPNETDLGIYVIAAIVVVIVIYGFGVQ
jgi:hypothetical protein